MYHFRHALVVSAVLPTVAAFGGQPSAAPPTQRVEQTSDQSMPWAFAPLWMPVARFISDDGAETPVPSPAYAPIWQPQWQADLKLSMEQSMGLQTIYDEAMDNARRRVEEYQRLSPAEQQARLKAAAAAGQTSPPDEVRQQIEAILTPQQLRALKDYSFPEYAVGLLYDAHVRREIAFDAQQELRLRQVIGERLSRFQRLYLERAELMWELLSPVQQSQAGELVKQQGPTSAVLSIAYELGFDMDSIGFACPMLTEQPVRDRLGLNADQQTQLTVLIAESAARRQTPAPAAPQQDLALEEKAKIDAILTADQQSALEAMDLRRQMVLALGYPEKRQAMGLTDKQDADRKRIEHETHHQLYRIDREQLGKGLAILTPTQRGQLQDEIDRRVYGK